MKTLVLVGFLALFVGCQAPRPVTPPPLVYSGGDGSSCEKAVVIRDAKCRELGLLAERLWLDETYPGYRESKFSALSSASRRYDVVELVLPKGEKRRVYFDTTEFFDK